MSHLLSSSIVHTRPIVYPHLSRRTLKCPSIVVSALQPMHIGSTTSDSTNVLPFDRHAQAVYTRQMSSLTEGVDDVAYELVGGPLVRFCNPPADGRTPPTAVLVHGILGQRRNMMTFAKRLLQEFPSWQVLLVDLRCHGESAASGVAPSGGPHGVESAASDVLKLLGRLKLFPEVLIGHSFGGKVVMSMAEQFGRVGRTLPKPVQVWVLDALPGEVRAHATGSEHPANIIRLLQSLPLPIADRTTLVQQLCIRGVSADIAHWLATNLKPTASSQGGLEWAFDLSGIAEMYESYETTHLWELICSPQQGLKIDFVRAERSSFRWGGEDEALIKQHGHGVHLLRDSGHWVHTDNLEGLVQILRPSFLHA